MFHVEFLIDDKDFIKLRQTLVGMKVFNYQDKPVVNAKKANGKVVEAVPGGKMIDRLIEVLRQGKTGDEISSAGINALVREMGGSPSSKHVADLVKAKIIKRTPIRGHFKLVAKGA